MNLQKERSKLESFSKFSKSVDPIHLLTNKSAERELRTEVCCNIESATHYVLTVMPDPGWHFCTNGPKLLLRVVVARVEFVANGAGPHCAPDCFGATPADSCPATNRSLYLR